MRVTSWFISLVVPSILMVGCSSEDPPVEGKFTVKFPSVAVSRTIDRLQLFVFDATNAPERCHQLVNARSSGGQFPIPPIAQTAPFEVCALVRSPNSIKMPEASFGDRAVVAVGSQGNTDKLIGCQHVTLGEGNFDSMPIPLAVIGGDDVTPTTCKTLLEHCDGRCS